MKIIFSEECLKYEQEGHPESSERVRSAYDFLSEKTFEFLKPEIAEKKDILRAHSLRLLNDVKKGNFIDPDSPPYRNIFYYASLSAGAAIKAMEIALSGEDSFSLMRPPGHHATRNSLGGFCYFNNIAIAVLKALENRNIKRVAIIDIDNHHGNGTQDIFLNNSKVIYISLHQFPYYPGTGAQSEKNCFNYPLFAGTTEEEYIEKLKEALIHVEKFAPDLIAISAGFDTFEEDPLSGLELRAESYEKIAEIIKDASLEKPIFSILEGGYSSKLKECIYMYLRGFQ